MRVVIDCEANSLTRPTKIWCIVCKDIDTGEYSIFREGDYENFLEFARHVSLWIGHNFLEYDYPVANKLLGLHIPNVWNVCVDTLLVSRLADYAREQGHSIEAYGEQFGLNKIHFNDWTQWSQEMEDYCVRDVDICHKVYLYHLAYINDLQRLGCLAVKNAFQYKVSNRIHDNGFYFDTSRATSLLEKVTSELADLDRKINDAFPARLVFVREVNPKLTKYGTLNKSDFRWIGSGDLSEFNGGPFCRCSWVEFNPSSHKQIVTVLSSAGWRPVDKTQSHIDTEREINRLKYSRSPTKEVDLKLLHDKLVVLQKSGWKVNETNLGTLPDNAPAPARLLAKRILLESRRRTLTEWLGLVQEDHRIHGKFNSIGTWTHRTSTTSPNMQNIPNEFELDGSIKLLGKELRQLWRAPRNRLLVGVDAEGIQLRIFAHYINDAEFTDALVRGRKEEKTDPHSLNQRILGPVCRSRAAAKRFIYALLLGAGTWKLGQILEASEHETKDALGRLMQRYEGFNYLKKHVLPEDGRRGYFIGLDGLKVTIPGATASERTHLAMSGYLQNGEKVIMERATLKWIDKIEKEYNSLLVNFVHDEWQAEVPNQMSIALKVAKEMSDSLEKTGIELGLKCPFTGSYWNDDHKDYTIGTNWYQTH